MKTNAALALLVALLSVATVTAGGVVINPGSESTLSNTPATGGSESTNGNFLYTLVSTHDLDAKRITAGVLSTPTSIGTGTASSQIFYDFEVGSTPETVNHTVGAWINYVALWQGSQAVLAVGASNATVDVDMVLRDLTESRNLHFESIHELDLKTFKVKFVLLGIDFDDSGSKVSTFPAVLKRGHTYRLTLRLSASVFLVAVPGSTSSQSTYFQGDTGGVRLSSLNVKVGLDERAVGDRFDAIEDRLDDIEERLEALENHRHIYLTGRGVGHNNVEATSSLPILIKPSNIKALPQQLLEEDMPAVKPEVVETSKPILEKKP
jgi:hypothetical protein